MSNSLLKDASTYSLGSILRKAFAFFLIPIYTRFLTVDEYGMLALLRLILQLATFIFLLGVSSAAMRYYFNPAKDTSYRKQVYGSAFILLLIIPNVFFLILGPLVYLLTNKVLSSVAFFPYIFIIFLIALLTPIETLMLSLLRVQKRARGFVIYTLSLFLVQTIFIILAVVFLKYGLKGLLFAQLITNIAFWIIALRILGKNSKFSFSWNISKKLLAFGIPLVPYFIFTWINIASGRFFLEKFASLRDVGIFALASQFTNFLVIMGLAFDNAVVPYFYETAQKPKAAKILGGFATKYFALLGLISLFTLAVAQPLILIMADSKFHGASKYIPLLILAGWLGLVLKLFLWNLLQSKKTVIISMLTGFSAFLMVILLTISLKYWGMGIDGVIYAMIAVNLIMIFAGFLFSQYHFKIKYNSSDLSFIFFIMLLSALIINYASFDESLILNFIVRLFILCITSILVIRRAKITNIKELIPSRIIMRKSS